MEPARDFDKARYLQELRQSGPLTAEYLAAIDASWEETSRAVREALAVIPRFVPFSRKKRALIFKRLCLRLDRLLKRKKLRFDNLSTVFIKLDLYDRRFGRISNAALRDYARNEYLWQGLSISASEYFSLNEPMIEMLHEGKAYGSGYLYLLASLIALMSQLISGSLSTTWEYIFSDLDSEAPGVIVASGPGWYERHSRSSYDIRYAYAIDGRSYVGNQIDFDSRIVAARQKIEKYPEGKPVTVYYDSAQPYYSVLERKPLGKGIYIQLGCIAAFFLLIWLSSSGLLARVIAERSAAPETAGQKKFSYRIPIVYRLFFAGILGVVALAEQGYLREFMPSGDLFKPLFTIAFIVVGVVMVLSPYRDSYLEFHEDHLVLPSLFIPPFRKRLIRYADIIELKGSIDENGYASIKLVLKRGKAKISSHYCYGKTILTFGSPDHFYDIRHVLESRLPESLISGLSA